MKSPDYLRIAKDAGSFTRKAGKLLAQHQSKAKIRGYKDIADIVTTADLASEKLLVSLIRAKYPGHSIDSEEMGVESKHSPYTWIIDPLDGTKEYARGITVYNCLIAVTKNDALVAGAMGCWMRILLSRERISGAMLTRPCFSLLRQAASLLP